MKPDHNQCRLLAVSVRMSYRRQKRWWNAYILFYERLDVMDTDRQVDVDRSKCIKVEDFRKEVRLLPYSKNYGHVELRYL